MFRAFLRMGVVGVAVVCLRGDAVGADPGVPSPWDRAVDELAEAQTLFWIASFDRMFSIPLHPSTIYKGEMYIRADTERLVVDIMQWGRLSFDGTELWFDRADNHTKPPYRLTTLEPIARQLVPYLRAGLPGATWRVVTSPEPGIPSVHDERWAEVRLPFPWAEPLRTYVRVDATGDLMTVRVVDAATGKRFDNGTFRSEIDFGRRYNNVPIEPDLHVRTERSPLEQGYPRGSEADTRMLYHERLLRLPLAFDAALSEGGPYPGDQEGPGQELGPVLCTKAGPTYTRAFSFVWMADPAESRVLLAQSASDTGCELHIAMEPIASLVTAGNVRGLVEGETVVVDASTMAVLSRTPLSFTRDTPGLEQGWTQAVEGTLPAGVEVAGLVVELSGTVTLQCMGPSVASNLSDKSYARVWVGRHNAPRLTWEHCGWQ